MSFLVMPNFRAALARRRIASAASSLVFRRCWRGFAAGFWNRIVADDQTPAIRAERRLGLADPFVQQHRRRLRLGLTILRPVAELRGVSCGSSAWRIARDMIADGQYVLKRLHGLCVDEHP